MSLHEMAMKSGVEISCITFNDNRVFDIFCDDNELREIPFCESDGDVIYDTSDREFVVDVFKTFQPRTMGELTRAVGCTVGIDVWVNNGELLVKNKIAAVDEVITSQDDVIDFLMTHYINPYDAWRIVKNIKNGKGLLENDRVLMKDHDVPEWYCDSCDHIKTFSSRCSNMAKAKIYYWYAYYKVYHRQIFDSVVGKEKYKRDAYFM